MVAVEWPQGNELFLIESVKMLFGKIKLQN